MASSWELIIFTGGDTPSTDVRGSYRVWNDETVDASITLPNSFDNVTQFKIKFKPKFEAKFEVDPEGIDVPERASRPLYYRKENGKAEVKIADDDLVTQQDLISIYNDLNSKQDQLTAGTGITISYDNVISATGGGGSVQVDGDTILDTDDELKVNENILPHFGQQQDVTRISGFDLSSSGTSTIKPGWYEWGDYDSFESDKIVVDHSYRVQIWTNSGEYSADDVICDDDSATSIFSGTLYNEYGEDPVSIYIKNDTTSPRLQVCLSGENVWEWEGTMIVFRISAVSNAPAITLGSKLGSGWIQDREYTVKFKNGKLYLS